MSWVFNGEETLEIPENAIGFIYVITNLISGKQYIGKKLLAFSKTTYKIVKLKNGTKKKKKIRSKIPSDWQDYWSSSDELKKDVLEFGQDKFTREILRYCNSKNELSYYEAKYQFEHDVLLNETKWYNGWISVKVRRFKLE
jgi:hypothetical protein